MTCPRCGFENAAGSRFCAQCAAPLEQAREVRKTVTVVFCDITGSTALGESVDPEALHALLGRYFERMRAILERHGGSVEKFIGDAVMAVFGVPVLHEDDALRALRAAAEMRAALPELGVQARIGVNTGEVVAGTGGTLVTGDAVNVAARLEQAAPPGEVYVGGDTVRLTHDRIEVEPVEPLALKGKSEPVAAYRLVSVLPEEPRRLGGAFVGREREQRLLRESFDLAVSDHACNLFTLLGDAGVGKSRLTAEFLRSLDATVVRGRCLSYGEGITYFPVVEVVKQLRPEERELDDPVARPLETLLGGDAPASKEEIAFAVRRLLELAAEERPLVVVWDDLHWAEEAFLDLVEQLSDWSRDAPILLLCMARPELLDRRPGWAGGKLRASTVLLEPLGRAASTELLSELAGEIDEALRERILDGADGNPLFVEEMVAMVGAADGEVAVPPTIQALLAARLDQLPAPERAALERGAVEGQVFHRSAVQALTPADAEVPARLLRLVRKELVRPERSILPGDDAFRFRHILIRDAAYDSLPKVTRAALHERFARWVEEQAPGLVEIDEIVGYHLEQAAGYLRELGLEEERASTLAERASRRLDAAARGALARDDPHAAANLLGRAAGLTRDDRARARMLAELAQACYDADDLRGAAESAAAAEELAGALGDAALAARAALARIRVELQVEPSGSSAEALAETERAIAVLHRPEDADAQARGWNLHALILFYIGNTEQSRASYEQARAAAQRAGDRRLEDQASAGLPITATYGPTPIPDAIRLCEELLTRVRDPFVRSLVLQKLSRIEAHAGHLDQARASYAEARAIAVEYGLRLREGVQVQDGALVEMAAGDYGTAERYLREGIAILAELGETGFRSTSVSELAEALLLQGRLDEAAAAAAEAQSLAQPDDWEPVSRALAVQGRVMALRGDAEGGLALLQEAVGRAEPTDFLEMRGDVQLALAEVARAANRPDDATAAATHALELYERKGHVIGAERARAFLGQRELFTDQPTAGRLPGRSDRS
jgi:class 3 adenylate cyclase/predicted ATPase